MTMSAPPDLYQLFYISRSLAGAEAVSQLDQVTQQNAALVEESAAAAESLKHQASRLVEAVQIFKL